MTNCRVYDTRHKVIDEYKKNMSGNKHNKDTWSDSDKLNHQFINESRHRDIASKIMFNLMCLVAAAIVCITIWLYWFS